MNELGALLSILPYALSVALLAALLHRLAAWSEGPSLADLVSGPRDLPWPRGVQEEEPVRWDVQRLRPSSPGSVSRGGSRRPSCATTGPVSDVTPRMLTRDLRRPPSRPRLTRLASQMGR